MTTLVSRTNKKTPPDWRGYKVLRVVRSDPRSRATPPTVWVVVMVMMRVAAVQHDE
jgi:hypothetical protein